MELITLIYIVTGIITFAFLLFLFISYFLYQKKKKQNITNITTNNTKEIEKQIEHINSFTVERNLNVNNVQNSNKSPFQKVENLEQKKKSDIKFN